MVQDFDALKTVPLRDLGCVLSTAPKKPLGEVRLFDLILTEDSPLPFTHGVYCFYDCAGTRCLYVGKVEGPQFIERLPSHLSLSEGSWFNQFMRGLKDECGSFDSAVGAARKCSLVIIPMPLAFITVAERILIERLNPKLNKRRSKSGYGGSTHDMTAFGEILRKCDECNAPSLEPTAAAGGSRAIPDVTVGGSRGSKGVNDFVLNTGPKHDKSIDPFQVRFPRFPRYDGD